MIHRLSNASVGSIDQPSLSYLRCWQCKGNGYCWPVPKRNQRRGVWNIYTFLRGYRMFRQQSGAIPLYAGFANTTVTVLCMAGKGPLHLVLASNRSNPSNSFQTFAQLNSPTCLTPVIASWSIRHRLIYWRKQRKSVICITLPWYHSME